MTKIPFGKTPEVVLTAPRPPRRITKKGLVVLAKTPEISGDDLTVLEAVKLAKEALTADEKLDLAVVLEWFDFVGAVHSFKSDQEED